MVHKAAFQSLPTVVTMELSEREYMSLIHLIYCGVCGPSTGPRGSLEDVLHRLTERLDLDSEDAVDYIHEKGWHSEGAVSYKQVSRW